MSKEPLAINGLVKNENEPKCGLSKSNLTTKQKALETPFSAYVIGSIVAKI